MHWKGTIHRQSKILLSINHWFNRADYKALHRTACRWNWSLICRVSQSLCYVNGHHESWRGDSAHSTSQTYLALEILSPTNAHFKGIFLDCWRWDVSIYILFTLHDLPYDHNGNYNTGQFWDFEPGVKQSCHPWQSTGGVLLMSIKG